MYDPRSSIVCRKRGICATCPNIICHKTGIDCPHSNIVDGKTEIYGPGSNIICFKIEIMIHVLKQILCYQIDIQNICCWTDI